MKRFVVFLISFSLLFIFCSCDYYTDITISETLPQPDENGLVEFSGGISTTKNTARVDLLKYELESAAGGQIKILLPETVSDDAGTEYPIDAFGGPIGTNAPLQKFDLIICIRTGTMPASPIELTVDAGKLPLNTENWNSVQICFLSDGAVTEIPTESVIFLSDEPLVYKLYLKEEKENGSVFDASDSEKWYEIPPTECFGGEKVIIRVRNPEDGTERRLSVTHEPVDITEVREEYTEYQFTMPYHNVRITIADET